MSASGLRVILAGSGGHHGIRSSISPSIAKIRRRERTRSEPNYHRWQSTTARIVLRAAADRVGLATLSGSFGSFAIGCALPTYLSLDDSQKLLSDDSRRLFAMAGGIETLSRAQII